MSRCPTGGLTGAGVGLFISAIQNSLQTHNKGAMGVFTRTGWVRGKTGYKDLESQRGGVPHVEVPDWAIIE
jgi:hypothetical protein